MKKPVKVFKPKIFFRTIFRQMVLNGITGCTWLAIKPRYWKMYIFSGAVTVRALNCGLTPTEIFTVWLSKTYTFCMYFDNFEEQNFAIIEIITFKKWKNSYFHIFKIDNQTLDISGSQKIKMYVKTRFSKSINFWFFKQFWKDSLNFGTICRIQDQSSTNLRYLYIKVHFY